jgi:MFS family permease
VSGTSQFRLLTLHYGFYQLSVALAGGFVGAYLMKLGFSLPAALIAYAGLLTTRFGLRFIALAVVRRLGYRSTMAIGAALGALQFLPLMRADEPIWLMAWLLVVSLAESLYWPVYHSAAAVTGGGASRGRELGIRTAVGALVGVVGPLAGGILLERFGPALDFSIAAALSLLSVVPLMLMRGVDAGPVPSMRESMRGIDRSGIATFAADGWMASGLALAWPMVLFTSLGSHYEAFGLANAAAGLVGAVAGLTCGRAIDRGRRDGYLVLVCAALALGFALRACASWSPVAAAIANASGAAVMGLYVPVLMSVIYDRAKQSGAAYQFHFAAEAGWDAGAASGCIAAALVAWATMVPSLAVLPAALGIWAIYRCVHGQSVPAVPGFGVTHPAPAN